MRILCREAIKCLPGEVQRLAQGRNKVLVITGSQSVNHPSISNALKILEAQFDIERYSVQSWLATIEEYEAFYLEHKETDFSCIITIGGGRIIDFGKLVGCRLPPDQVREEIKDQQNFLRSVPLIALPTTAGSGAEATPYAVFYFSGEKSTLSHPSLLPDSEIVDPDLLTSLSTYQLAISGADAVCQSIESIFSPLANEESLLLSLGGFSLGIPALRGCVQEKLDQFGESMCLASNLAGQAITQVRTNVPHALSYYLTSHYDIPHGQAVSIYMAAYLEDALTKVEELKPSKTLVHVCNQLKLSLGASTPQEASTQWKKFMEEIGLLPFFSHHSALIIREGIIRSSNVERLQNLIVPLNIKEIIKKSICEKE